MTFIFDLEHGFVVRSSHPLAFYREAVWNNFEKFDGTEH